MGEGEGTTTSDIAPRGRTTFGMIGWRWCEKCSTWYQGKKCPVCGKKQEQVGETPRVFYRGEDPTSKKRIRTGDRYWDSLLFVSSDVSQARMYASPQGYVVRYAAKSDAQILYQGTREFARVAKGLKHRAMMDISIASEIAERAEAEGYDAVWFIMQGNLGTAIINPEKFKRNEKRKSVNGRTEARTDEQFKCPHCDAKITVRMGKDRQGNWICPTCGDVVRKRQRRRLGLAGMFASESLTDAILEDTARDLKKMADPDFLDQGTRKKKVGGPEFVNMDPEDTIIFSVESGTEPGKHYEIMVQLLGFEDAKADVKQTVARRAARALAGDLRVRCSCPSFLYHGFQYLHTFRDTQVGSAERRYPDVRNPDLLGMGCKHLARVIDELPRMAYDLMPYMTRRRR